MNNTKYLLNILNIFGYKDQKKVDRLKEKLSEIYSNDDLFVTVNGRTAIYLFLKSLGLEPGSKVAVQAFTCNAVINPILSADLNPLYIDINPASFNMSYDDFLKKIDSSVKVLILQHTFGLRADDRIIEYCKVNGIYVLEDCAHTLGETSFGSMGDASIVSFGIEKLLPTRVGGALIVNNKDLLPKITGSLVGQKQTGNIQTFLWLIHPILWRVIRSLPISTSNSLKVFLKRVGALKSGFTASENIGNEKYSILQGISGILADIILDCLYTLQSVIRGRKEISGVYFNLLDQKYEAYIRYPYVAGSVEKAEKIISYLESLGYSSRDRWFEPVVFPRSTNLDSMKYISGSCPVAEDISSRIVNLPTGSNVSVQKAKEISEKILSMR
jgi:perosamine synthetase